jgi:hypothetical protein
VLSLPKERFFPLAISPPPSLQPNNQITPV